MGSWVQSSFVVLYGNYFFIIPIIIGKVTSINYS